MVFSKLQPCSNVSTWILKVIAVSPDQITPIYGRPTQNPKEPNKDEALEAGYGGITMKTDKHSLFITAYDYDVLTKNYLISTLCAKQMKSANERGDEVELILIYS